MNERTHIPVLLSEALSGLNIRSNGIYVDLTLGRAGHSQEILRRIPAGHLYGFDQDPDALAASQEILSRYGKNYTLIHANFADAREALANIGVYGVDGILMDLGVSSPQFDEGDRGFSYRFDAPLDMRMDPTSNRKTAAELLQTLSVEELTKIFREYGEDRFAYKVAVAIVQQRAIKPIWTTGELVELIKRVKPESELRKKGHPAKQIFQALRIAVNDELGVLERALRSMIPLLNPHGRMVIITFHSLEDRLVKQIFREYAVVIGDKRIPYQVEKDYLIVNRKVITPSDEELIRNHRATSAKLRILERK